MKTIWLHHKKKPSLIIFFNGWGMDEKPFVPLAAIKYDVLIFYDYQDFNAPLDIEKLSQFYEEIVLIAWSMGVWVGQRIFAQYQSLLTSAIAINGTLAPVDDQYGIPGEIFAKTHVQFDEKTCNKFYKRMCREKNIFEMFLANKPLRSLENQQEELGLLLSTTTNISVDLSIYTEIIVADKDYVMPTRNQLHFWRKNSVQYVDGYHFLFYGWNSWDELIENPGLK